MALHLIAMLVAGLGPLPSTVPQEKVLWRARQAYGRNPGTLTRAGRGALYGSASAGGLWGAGTIFKVAPTASGATTTVIWNFDGLNGRSPVGPLLMGQLGTIIGTTAQGGANNLGTFFELAPGNLGYRQMVLFSMTSRTGDGPTGIVAGGQGAYYGAAGAGGDRNDGTVFKLTPTTQGYRGQRLWSFGKYSGDGIYPDSPLISDAVGNFYGTTATGGSFGYGAVFKLTPARRGYTEKVVWSFGTSANDGLGPGGSLAIDETGALYGTTIEGGTGPCSNFGRPGCGVVYKLTPAGSSGYTESIVWNFGAYVGDGEAPVAGVARASSGVLFGTTASGGVFSGCNYLESGCGTLYTLAPQQHGYSETVQWNFGGSSTDGTEPTNVPLPDPLGGIYGTTSAGGGPPCSCGTVYTIFG